MDEIWLRMEGQDIGLHAGDTVETAVEKAGIGHSTRIMVAQTGNRLTRLDTPAERLAGREVKLLDLGNSDGIRVYVRALCFVMAMACERLYPGAVLQIEHSVSKGLLCELVGGPALDEAAVQHIRDEMRALVDANLRIERIEMPIGELIEYSREKGLTDRARLLAYRTEEMVHPYRCGDYTDYYYGYLTPRTGYLQWFDLVRHEPGMILRYPRKGYGNALPPYLDSPKHFDIFAEAERLGALAGVRCVADVNDLILAGQGADMVRICEALHEKKIAAIADRIAERIGQIKLVLVAGPSASGKTTFVQRLRVQLMTNGIRCLTISLDNYYKERTEAPLGPDGQPDLEALAALDTNLFNRQIHALARNKTVRLPIFDFTIGKQVPGPEVHLEPDQVLLVEGIHGLNEALSESIPHEQKYKIYVSALTQLNMDEHNRIPTTDTRLIRRLVRDARHRGSGVGETIAMWPSVRLGEKKYIFPHQEQADIMFNSAMPYELAALKEPALKIMEGITEEDTCFIEVHRLRKFLQYFTAQEHCCIPPNSILREFIGDSCFTE
jgi:uridine kinase